MRHELLDHLRTHEKDRWTLIHINSYTYITHTKRALDISLPFQDASFPSYSPLLFRDIHFVSLLPCNDFDIFATDGRREYTCKYTLFTYISHGVQATLLRADVFVWSSFHWLRKKRGRVVKVQSVKRRVMNLDLIYSFLFFLFLIITFTSSRNNSYYMCSFD